MEIKKLIKKEIESHLNFTLMTNGKAYKRFILTYEFAEYLLQDNKTFANFPYYIYKGEDKKFQSKINRAVAELLMLETVLRKIVYEALLYVENVNLEFINELSDYFKVSKNFVKIKLKSPCYEVIV
ncbi:MAG: hypothetical protein C0175_01845 [Caldisericum exile]|uniref:IrrE N-terminal-like domain-containing protein n=1 Tax=Caldisericum exile TaxID=693075 RepID=A0A2J6X8A4_9BACT|nr:MAG: hypothetical protein C0175_01845 [Caldisericum exile]